MYNLGDLVKCKSPDDSSWHDGSVTSITHMPSGRRLITIHCENPLDIVVVPEERIATDIIRRVAKAPPVTMRIREDRSLDIAPGHIVCTGYVDVFKVRLACRERMAIGDIDRAYQRRLQLGSTQPWPCPNGEWDGDTFVIYDGRHEWLATVALGNSHILVAWTAPAGK